MVLCDIHHRHPHHGIHHILAQDFFIQPFLFGGYEIVADAQNVEKAMVANERVSQRAYCKLSMTHLLKEKRSKSGNGAYAK